MRKKLSVARSRAVCQSETKLFWPAITLALTGWICALVVLGCTGSQREPIGTPAKKAPEAPLTKLQQTWTNVNFHTQMAFLPFMDLMENLRRHGSGTKAHACVQVQATAPDAPEGQVFFTYDPRVCRFGTGERQIRVEGQEILSWRRAGDGFLDSLELVAAGLKVSYVNRRGAAAEALWQKNYQLKRATEGGQFHARWRSEVRVEGESLGTGRKQDRQWTLSGEVLTGWDRKRWTVLSGEAEAQFGKVVLRGEASVVQTATLTFPDWARLESTPTCAWPLGALRVTVAASDLASPLEAVLESRDRALVNARESVTTPWESCAGRPLPILAHLLSVLHKLDPEKASDVGKPFPSP